MHHIIFVIQVINFVEETPPPVGVPLPTWVWIVVGVGGILLVGCLVTILLSVICTARKKR